MGRFQRGSPNLLISPSSIAISAVKCTYAVRSLALLLRASCLTKVDVACRLERQVSRHPRPHAKTRGALLGRQQLHRPNPALSVNLEAPYQDQFQSQQHVGSHSTRPGEAAVGRLPDWLGYGFQTVRHQRWKSRASVAPQMGRQYFRLPSPTSHSQERMQCTRKRVHAVAAELFRARGLVGKELHVRTKMQRKDLMKQGLHSQRGGCDS